MIVCGCIVQEGQLPAAQLSLLEQGLGAIAMRYFDLPATVLWTPVAAGNGWTAGAPSTSSLAMMYVPAGLDQGVRTRLLADICDLWRATTGCSINEIVATALDLPQ